MTPNGNRFAMKLDQYKAKALGHECRRAATDFSFNDVVKFFKLKYSEAPSRLSTSHLQIRQKSDFYVTLDCK